MTKRDANETTETLVQDRVKLDPMDSDLKEEVYMKQLEEYVVKGKEDI